MNRRRFLGLFTRAAAAAPFGLLAWHVAPAPAQTWKVEWFERDFPWDRKTGYAIRATSSTGQVRAHGWMVPTVFGRARTIQRAAVKHVAWHWLKA